MGALDTLRQKLPNPARDQHLSGAIDCAVFQGSLPSVRRLHVDLLSCHRKPIFQTAGLCVIVAQHRCGIRTRRLPLSRRLGRAAARRRGDFMDFTSRLTDKVQTNPLCPSPRLLVCGRLDLR